MKHKLITIVLAFFWITSLALAQVDKATGTSTNDATMARLRVAHLVFGGQNIDVMLNGEIAMNVGQAQVDIRPAIVTGYMYLNPGTYSLALVPTGKGVEEALVGPLDLQLKARDRYTVALMGQVEDASLKPLVIDETAALSASRTDPSQFTATFINNVAGSTKLDFNKSDGGPSIHYGDYVTSTAANGDGHACTEFSIAFDDTIVDSQPLDECGILEPGMDFIVAFMGHFPGENFRDTQSGNTSELNALDFLKGFSGLGYNPEGVAFTFDTFLAAMEKAGLTDLLTTGGPYLIYVPNDDAFAALPKEQFDALMADPQALADVLRTTMFEGYYPQGTLSAGYDNKKNDYNFDRTLTNVLGDEVKLLSVSGLFTINRIDEGHGQRYQVANGSFVRPIPTLIFPPSQ